MKKVLVILFIVVLLSIGIYYFYPKTSSTPENPLNSTSSSSGGMSSSTIPHVPVDIFGDDSHSFFDVFVNTSTKTAVSFKEVPSSGSGASGNGLTDVYLNNKKIAQVGSGPLAIQFGFSPNNKYFGWKNQYDGGGGSFTYEIDIINLITNKIIKINQPTFSFSDPKIDPTERVVGLIESYTWDGDAINTTFYFVGLETDGKYYRLSPKEIWRYDLISGDYILLKTLPF